MTVTCHRPAEKYKGWFNTVLKTARLAVLILKMLSEEVCNNLSCVAAST